MILKHKAELAGRVKLQISGGERGTIDYDWFDNMILDQGLRQLISAKANDTGIFTTFAVGASSQAVSSTDVGVIEPIAKIFTNSQLVHGYDETLGFGWSRTTKSFPRGAAAGNISEVACGQSNSYTTSACRALIRDSAGNPTTITVLSDEVLTVTWELRRWWTVPPANTIDYLIDDVTHSTVVSYTPLSALPRTPDTGIGAGGVYYAEFEAVSDFVGIFRSVYVESVGNPAISKAGLNRPLSNSGGIFPSLSDYATFTPPIPKTINFKINIVWELTLSRRGE